MLTPRQQEIGALVARGMTTREIARQTGLAIPTVKDHIKRGAAQLPGDTSPRHRLMVWFFSTKTPAQAA